MSDRQRALVAVLAMVLCLGATQYAMRGLHTPTGNVGYLGTDIAGVEGSSVTDSSPGVYGTNPNRGSSGSLGVGVIGAGGFSAAANGIGVRGDGHFGVLGESISTDASACGISGTGVYTGVIGHVTGTATTNAALKGYAQVAYAVHGATHNGTGVFGEIYAGGTGHAGYFLGAVTVVGDFTHTASSLRIDHPTDPAGKYLTHSTVESSERVNVYSGTVKLEADGTAVVKLPDWFEALNEDFRYQLTCIGEHAPVYVAEEIHENRFRIAGGYAGMKISWEVTGVRHDPYAQAHPLVVEQIKAPHEVGRFVDPEVYRQHPALRIMPNPPQQH